MTEEEAAVLTARLTRIWEPLEAEIPVLTPDHWLFYARIRDDVDLQATEAGDFSLGFYSADAVEWELGDLRASGDGTITFHPVYEQDKVLAAQFAEEWLPFFRRGCWLSGCDIEASAHEKAEWIQGFSCEEIEAWNLKM